MAVSGEAKMYLRSVAGTVGISRSVIIPGPILEPINIQTKDIESEEVEAGMLAFSELKGTP